MDMDHLAVGMESDVLCEVCGRELVKLERTSGLAGRSIFAHRDASIRDHAPKPR